MSDQATTTTDARGERIGDEPAWRATAAGGATMVAALALALAHDTWGAIAVTVAIVGAVVSAFVLAPRALAAVHRQPAVLMVAVLGALMVVWLLAAVTDVPFRSWMTYGSGGYWESGVDIATSDLWPLLLMLAAATAGVVLIADALRVRLGLAGQRARATPWRQMTGPGAQAGLGFPWRAVAGVLLVGWAAFAGFGVVRPYLTDRPGLMVVFSLLAAGGVAVVVGTPLLIAALARSDQEDVAAARDRDRQRFGAHLHDSVLQTLALVQRQAHDPSAVTRLARRQEHALRAWMAGEAELASETLVAALRDVVAEVEDERGVTIELSAIGDRPLDAGGEALAAAAREALRNAATHGGGAAVIVFAEVSPDAAEVFVRDDGPGFAMEDVPTERRGVRDAIVGRMAAAGGRATVESAPGEGTEVALRLGEARR